MNEDAFTQSVLNRAADILVDMFEKAQQVGGPMGDQQTAKEQMAAYMQYKGMSFDEQAQVRMGMDAQHGPGESVRWEREMESRYQQSVKKKVLPFSEVL